MIIELDRESVCMGDDCMSHKIKVELNDSASLLDLFTYIQTYIPCLYETVWVILSKNRVCGYITIDNHGTMQNEINTPSALLSNLQISSVNCLYYYQSSFSWTIKETGERVSKHDECTTLLQKVQKEMRDKTTL